MTVTDLPRSPAVERPQSQDPENVQAALEDPAYAGWVEELTVSHAKLVEALLES